MFPLKYREGPCFPAKKDFEECVLRFKTAIKVVRGTKKRLELAKIDLDTTSFDSNSSLVEELKNNSEQPDSSRRNPLSSGVLLKDFDCCMQRQHSSRKRKLAGALSSDKESVNCENADPLLFARG